MGIIHSKRALQKILFVTCYQLTPQRRSPTASAPLRGFRSPEERQKMLLALLVSAAATADTSDHELAQRLKLSLWQRGVLECGADGCGASSAEFPRLAATWLSQQHLPIVRLRGGADGCGGTSCEPPSANLDALRAELGEEFAAALDQNEADHADDCAASCESFYCGPGAQLPAGAAEARSHSMGSVPPEECAPRQALFSLAAWSRTRLCLQSRTSPTPSSSRSI